MTEDLLHEVYLAARDGLTDEEVAKRIDWGYSTFRKWKDKSEWSEQIKAALKRGRQESVKINLPKVENMLLKRCLGWEYEEERTEMRKRGRGENAPIEQVRSTVTKKVLPSDSAIFFYLVNNSGGRYMSINNPGIVGNTSKGQIQEWLSNIPDPDGKK